MENKVNENDEDIKKQNASNNKQKLINDLCDNQTRDESKKNDFLDSIFLENKVPEDIIKDMLKADGEDSTILNKEGKYKGVTLNNIKLSDLKIHLFSKYNRLKFDRQTLENAITSDYDIPGDILNKKIIPEINKLSQKELDAFLIVIKSDDKDKIGVFSRRDKEIVEFLVKVFGKEHLPNKKKKTNEIMSGIRDSYSFLSEEEINKIDNENNNILSEIIAIDNSKLLVTTDLYIFKEVLNLKIIGNNVKKKIILNFLPNITYSDAKKIGLVNDLSINDKEKIIRNNFLENEINDVKIEHLVSNINFQEENIILNTADLLSNDKNIDKIIASFDTMLLSNFFAKFNQELDEFNENIDKDLDGFKNKLLELDNVKGVENFIKGSYIIINQETSVAYDKGPKEGVKKGESIVYAKITDTGLTDGIVKLLDKGTNEFYNKGNKSYSLDFASILNFIENGNKEEGVASITEFEVISEKEIKERLLKDEIKKGTDTDFTDEMEFDNITGEIEKQKSNRVAELRNKYVSEGKNEKEIKTLIENDSEIVDFDKQLEKASNFNKEELKRQLSKIDTTYDSVKYDFDIGTTFTTKKAAGTFYYRIAYFDQTVQGGKIIVTDMLNRNTELTFIDFISAFKEQSCTITSYSNSQMLDFSSMIEKLKSEDDETKGNWGDFKFSDNGIIKKSTNNDSEKSGIIYDYLVADGDGKGDELIQIHNISGNKVTISFGEYNEKKHEDNDDSKGIKKGDVQSKSFGVDDKQFTITIGELYSRIAKFKLKPRCLDEEKDVNEKLPDTNDIKGHFWSRFFKKYSFNELIQGGKLGLDSIENYLKEGQEENAAKFASGFFGSFLPEDLKNDLTTRVESAKKKRQDDYIQKLKDVDSGPATEMIIGWLLNKDVPQHKKEAGMIFMLEKYGVLYAKKLTQYKGSFLWYEAMGGKVGDKLYMEEKAKAEEKDMPFTEEQLMYILTIRQCKGKQPPKRRSRLHKDFNRCRNQGKDEEFKTGEIDATNRRTLAGRIDYVFGEMEGGTYPNARGGYETVIGKGGPMHEMSEVPFVMLFSGVAMGYEEGELDKWKSIIAKGYLIPITKFLGNKSSINKFTDTVLKVCEIIQNDGKHTSILSDALKVFNNQGKTEGDEEKIKRCRKFYSKYGKILSDSLNMLNISDTGEDSKYADVIVLNKDKEGNQILKDYYNQFKSPDIPLFDNEDLMTDPFLYAGTSGIDIKKATTDILGLMTGGTLKKKRAAPHFWKEITDSFNAIANKKYSSNDDRTTKLKHELRYLLAGFMENNGGSEDFISSYNSPSFMFSRLNDWGVYLKDLSQLGISIDDMESGNNQKFEKVLGKYVDQIIKFERGEHESYRKDEKDPGGLTSIVDITKKATNNTVSDDYDQQIAA